MLDRSPAGPTFTTSRGTNADAGPTGPADESVVTDTRGGLRPAEIVERKLVQMLRGVVLPVSHISTTFRTR